MNATATATAAVHRPEIHLPEPDADETGPYVLIGSCRARPGCADALEKLILSQVASIRAEAGAVEFHVHRDRADRDVFVVYEVYRSVGELRAHVMQASTQQFIFDVQPLVDGGLRQQFLRMCSALPD